jgi:hypothetical protein
MIGEIAETAVRAGLLSGGEQVISVAGRVEGLKAGIAALQRRALRARYALPVRQVHGSPL